MVPVRSSSLFKPNNSFNQPPTILASKVFWFSSESSLIFSIDLSISALFSSSANLNRSTCTDASLSATPSHSLVSRTASVRLRSMLLNLAPKELNNALKTSRPCLTTLNSTSQLSIRMNRGIVIRAIAFPIGANMARAKALNLTNTFPRRRAALPAPPRAATRAPTFNAAIVAPSAAIDLVKISISSVSSGNALTDCLTQRRKALASSARPWPILLKKLLRAFCVSWISEAKVSKAFAASRFKAAVVPEFSATNSKASATRSALPASTGRTLETSSPFNLNCSSAADTEPPALSILASPFKKL